LINWLYEDKSTMRRFFSIELFETVLIMVTMTGFLMVPHNRIPRLVWPLSVGIIFLLIYAFQQTKPHTFFEENLGALMGGTIFTVVGITLLFNSSAYLAGLGIGLAAALLVGIVWTVLKTRDGTNKTP
jgi:hypothetical protein